MDDNDHSDESNDESQFGTQEETDILTNIRDKYGHLGKDYFRNELVNQFCENDLASFRQGLYNMSVKTVENTPIATLVTRKDTQQSGGQPLDEKLAEDIYNLFHYIQGDSSVDIYKLFPEREKSRLKKEAMARPNPDSRDTIVNTRSVRAPEQDISKTMIDFCQSFLTEMRKDRDLLIDDIKDIKKDTSLIREFRVEIKEMKRTVTSLSQKVDSLNEQIHVKQRQLDKIQDAYAHLEHDMKQLQLQQDERYQSCCVQIAKMSQTNQSCDVSRDKSYADALTGYVGRHSTTNTNTSDTNTSGTDKSRASSVSNRRETPASTLPSNPLLSNTVLLPATDKDVTTKITTSHNSDPVTTSEIAPFTTVVRRQRSLLSKHTSQTSKSHPPPSNHGTLQGFIPKEKRPQLDAIYVAGILAEGYTDEEIKANIEKYITNQGKSNRSVRIISHKGNTVAAKIVLKCDDLDSFITPRFWPEGIHVRKWSNRESTKL